MLNGVSKKFVLSMFCVFVVMVSAFVVSNAGDTEPEKTLLKPDKVLIEQENEQEYIFDISKRTWDGHGIAFYTTHQYVTVEIDDKVVYECLGSDSVFGHTTAAVWNFIHVAPEAKQVSIRLEQVYEDYDMESLEVYGGGDRELYCSLLEESIVSMLFSGAILLIGLFLIAVWAIVGRNSATSKSLFYLGTLGLMFGGWSFSETMGATILIDDRVACSFTAFVLLKMMGPTFLLFTHEYLNAKRNIIWKIYWRVAVAECIVTLLLQAFNIADLKETAISTHVSIAFAIIYAVIIAVLEWKKEPSKRQVKVYLAGLLIITVSASADMIHYYMGGGDADSFGRIGFLIFACVVAKQAANSTLNLMEKGRYAALYEKLAIVDQLTGLYNRNAYEFDMTKIRDLTGFMIVTFDLNDLKTCNDTKGHQQGDVYIMTAAKMIEQIFGVYGRCYRIGGDEFCCVIRNGETCPVAELLERLGEEQKDYNDGITDKEFPVHIAAGYALYDAKTDVDIEQTRNRADVYMYQNKRYIKSEKHRTA